MKLALGFTLLVAPLVVSCVMAVVTNNGYAPVWSLPLLFGSLFAGAVLVVKAS